MGQDLSSISSMDSNARRQPPPDVGVASSRIGAGETVPLIPNLVMSPGTLASDSEIQREVRVDDNVHEPTYGQSQAGEEMGTTISTQRSRSSPPRPTPVRPASLPSGQGATVEVPRPETLPQTGGGAETALRDSPRVDRASIPEGRQGLSVRDGLIIDGASQGAGPSVAVDQRGLEGELTRAHRPDELAPEELHPDYTIALQGQPSLGSVIGAGDKRPLEALNRGVSSSQAPQARVDSGQECAQEGALSHPSVRDQSVLEGLLRGITAELHNLGGRIQNLEGSRSSSARSRQSRGGRDFTQALLLCKLIPPRDQCQCQYPKGRRQECSFLCQ